MTSSDFRLIAASAASRLAFVVLFATEMASTGVTAVLPLLPPSATLSIAFFDAALIVTAPALISCAVPAPWPSSALVSVSPMFRLKTAPTPVLPPLVCLPVPLAVTAMKFSALISTAPLPVMVTVVPSSICALVLLMPTLMTSAPATLVAPPLAPATASTPRRLCAVVNVRSKVFVVVAPMMVNALIGLDPSAFADSLMLPSSCSTT